MLTILYYLVVSVLCTIFMIPSIIALVVCYPFDKGRRVVHELSRVLTFLSLGASPLWRFKVKGLENVDKSKQYVIVVNHSSMFDIPTLYHVPLNFRWVSKREVFKTPFFGQYLYLHGDIAIDRGRASEAMEQLNRKGKYWIERKASIAIFPEGTRSKSGEIGRFKAGAFLLAKAAGVEILPVVFNGTNKLINKKAMIQWRRQVDIEILKPISVEEIHSSDVQELTSRTQAQMTEVLTQLRKS